MDTNVAGVSSARSDVIQGKQPGSTTVHLDGRLGREPSVALTVSDTLVMATTLIALKKKFAGQPALGWAAQQ